MVIMLAVISKKAKVQNSRPNINTAWRWHKWGEFVNYRPIDIQFATFFTDGYDDLKKVKREAGIEKESDQIAELE